MARHLTLYALHIPLRAVPIASILPTTKRAGAFARATFFLSLAILGTSWFANAMVRLVYACCTMAVCVNIYPLCAPSHTPAQLSCVCDAQRPRDTATPAFNVCMVFVGVL